MHTCCKWSSLCQHTYRKAIFGRPYYSFYSRLLILVQSIAGELRVKGKDTQLQKNVACQNFFLKNKSFVENQ
jgi:hypothetical protein